MEWFKEREIENQAKQSKLLPQYGDITLLIEDRRHRTAKHNEKTKIDNTVHNKETRSWVYIICRYEKRKKVQCTTNIFI